MRTSRFCRKFEAWSTYWFCKLIRELAISRFSLSGQVSNVWELRMGGGSTRGLFRNSW